MKKILVLAMVFGGALLSAQQNAPAHVFDEQSQQFAGRAADRRQERALRVRVDALESAARGRRSVRVPLTTGDIVVRLSEFAGQADGFFARGPVVDAPAGQRIDGEATFTVVNDVLVGRIVHGGRLFMMRRVGETDVHRLAEIDERALPSEMDPRTAPVAEAEGMAPPADPTSSGDTNQFVDLLVVYTPAARAAIGGTSNMQAEVVGAVNNANAALAASNITHRLRLVHQTEVTYTEVGYADLDRLTDVGDGVLDEVHQLRDVYRADLVSFVGTSNACGVGWLLQNNSLSSQDIGFNVNHWSCINAALTMAHEIGHNMGVHHDRKNARNSNGQLMQGSSVYAYGYRVPGARDVMSYPCNLPSSSPESFSCDPRRTIFSTPAANFSGTSSPAGVANSEDNARALNDTSPTVANFRDATCSYALSAGRTTFGVGGGATTMTVTTGAGCAWAAVSGDTGMLALSGTQTRVGSGSFTVAMSALSGAESRSAVVYAGGESLAFQQVEACDPAIAYSATSFPSTGGGGTATVTFPSGCSTTAWSATSSESFLAITSGASGTGSGAVTFELTTSTVSAPRTAVLTIAGQGTTITQAETTKSSQAPIGAFDTPSEASSVAGSIAVTGWALDDVGIDRVEIWRDRITNDPAPPFLQDGHPANGKVFIANGTFVEGTRPDVEQVYRPYPASQRAGWGYLLLTWGFPDANGTFVLTAVAWDGEGQSTVLGRKTITVDNAASTKPFGSIDVPESGATFSGHNWTYGWALTPNAGCTMSGGQHYMTIDSAPPNFAITYGSNRTDVAAAFPGFQDSNGAGGAVALNAANYTNGTHQIGWLVYDSCGNGEGIGSRFFTILNGGSARAGDPGTSTVVTGTGPAFSRVGARAPNELSPSRDPMWVVRGMGTVETSIAPDATVWLSQTGRVEVHVTRPGIEPAPGLRYEAYLVAGDRLRALPIGSSFDAARGSLYWQPVAGFLGEFKIRILALRGDVPEAAWTVSIVVSPGVDQLLLQIDSAGCEVRSAGPARRSLGEGGCVVRGWSMDPQSTDGSGIGHVHIWAGATFMGAATLGQHRADVGDWYGRQFDTSGFALALPEMAPGEHDLVVYAWSLRTGRWEAARIIRIHVPSR